MFSAFVDFLVKYGKDLQPILWLIQIVAILVGGPWALFVLNRVTRNKTGELLVKLEERYKDVHLILLGIEYTEYFRKFYQPALVATALSVDKKVSPKYEEQEVEAINRLETALRYLYTCSQIKNLGFSDWAFSQLHNYYLGVLVPKEEEQAFRDREYLVWYIRKYWPGVYFWAMVQKRHPLTRSIWRLRYALRRLSYWNNDGMPNCDPPNWDISKVTETEVGTAAPKNTDLTASGNSGSDTAQSKRPASIAPDCE